MAHAALFLGLFYSINFLFFDGHMTVIPGYLQEKCSSYLIIMNLLDKSFESLRL